MEAVVGWAVPRVSMVVVEGRVRLEEELQNVGFIYT